MTYKLSALAEMDLEDIAYDTYLTRGSQQEEAYLAELTKKLEYVGRNPGGVGTKRDDVRSGYKSYPAGSHKLWFYVSGKDAVIVRVLHQSTDPLNHL